MDIIVLTPVRLFGEGLAHCFDAKPGMCAIALVSDLAGLRSALSTTQANIALIDVTQGVSLSDVRAISVEWPHVPLVALGLNEQRQEVVRCGQAGFAGYIARNASIDSLCTTLGEIVEGRLNCPPEISGCLLRALFRKESISEPSESDSDPDLTKRESEVLELLGQGLSNKEISNKLCLSVATVKHHVHNILEKLKLERRAQVMRRVRDAPWLARMGSQMIRN